jgi:hypothetical protein
LLIALKKKKKMGEYVLTKLQARGGMLLYFAPFLLVSSMIARPGWPECRVTFRNFGTLSSVLM